MNYVMIGKNSSNEIVTWTTISPDYSGDQAPEAVIDIAVLSQVSDGYISNNNTYTDIISPQWGVPDTRHIYVDNENGSNTNTGNLSTDPVASLDAAMQKIGSIIKGPTIIHLKNNDLPYDGTALGYRRDYLAHLIISGELKNVANKTATGNTDSYHITFSSFGEPNQYKGYLIRATSGSNNGVVRTILNHTETEVHTDSWPYQVQNGDTFELVRQTEIEKVGKITTQQVLTQNDPHIVFSNIQFYGINFDFVGSASFFGCTTAGSVINLLSGTYWAGRNDSAVISALLGNTITGCGLSQKNYPYSSSINIYNGAVLYARGCSFSYFKQYGGLVRSYGCTFSPNDSSRSIEVFGGSIELSDTYSPNYIDCTNDSIYISSGSVFTQSDTNLIINGSYPLIFEGSSAKINNNIECNTAIKLINGANIQVSGILSGSGDIVLGENTTIPFWKINIDGSSYTGPFGIIENANPITEDSFSAIFNANTSLSNGPLVNPDRQHEIRSAQLNIDGYFNTELFTNKVDCWHLVTECSIYYPYDSSTVIGNVGNKLIVKLDQDGHPIDLRGGFDFEPGVEITVISVDNVEAVGTEPVLTVTDVWDDNLIEHMGPGSVYFNNQYGFRYEVNNVGNWFDNEYLLNINNINAQSDIVRLSENFVTGERPNNIGQLNWKIQNSDPGYTVSIWQLNVYGRLGVVEMGTGNALGQKSRLHMGTYPDGYNNQIIDPNSVTYMSYIAKIPNTTDVIVRMGLMSLLDTDPGSSGLYFEYDSSESTNWVLHLRKSNTNTSIDSGIFVNSSKFYFLEMIKNGNMCELWINRSYIGSLPSSHHSAGLPISLGFFIQTQQAANKTLILDDFELVYIKPKGWD